MKTMTSSTEMPFTRAFFPPLKMSSDATADRIAYAQGHTAGYTAGLRKAAAEAEARRAGMEAEHAAVLAHALARTDRALAALAAAVAALDAAVVPVLADSQDTLVAAALDLAEAILGRELADEETSARAALARAIAGTHPAGARTVRMHPADLSVLNEAERATAGVVFVGDLSVNRGDAFTEFETGYLDARIASALDRAREALLGEDQ
jgi:flagellar assembly protein FliH